MRSFLPRAAQRGVTMIEMMVSITIGLVVVGAATYTYIGSKGAYSGNESLARIQEAGRFALDSIARDIRSAGALGCGSSQTLAGQTRVNVIPTTTTTAVNPTVLSVDPGGSGQPAPVQGVAPTAYVPLPVPAGAWPAWIAPTGAAPYWGGDILQLQIATGVGVRMSAGPDTTAGTITIPDNRVANFKQNDYALLGDCSSAALFQVNSVSGAAPAVLLTYKTGAVVPQLNAPGLPGFSIMTFPTVQHFDQVTYYVGTIPNSNPPRSALYRYSMATGLDEEVVENVEDLDVRYGIGAGGALTGDFQPASVMAPGDWANVISVRVSLVAAGDKAGVAQQRQTFTLHGVSWTAPDTRLRQVFTGTIALRDRLQ